MRLPIPFIHRWRAMKHGYGLLDLDARECRWCGRFEVWAYNRFWKAERWQFEPVVPADQSPDRRSG